MGIKNFFVRSKDTPKARTKSSVTTGTKAADDSFGISLFQESKDTISKNNAMKVEAVFSCMKDRATTIGRLPITLYDNNSDGTVERVLGGRLNRIFTKKPCSFMTMQGFLEFMMLSYDKYGAFYAYPIKNDRGNIMEIVPIRFQGNVVPSMDMNGNVYYTYTTNDNRPRITFGTEDLFIVKRMTSDGFTPITPIEQYSKLLMSTYNTEDNWGELQDKGITSQFALKTDKTVTQEAAQRLKKDWSLFRGTSGITNIPVLENGMDIKSLQISPKDSELLSNREFNVNRICRAFDVPPERIGVNVTTTSGTTLADIDESFMRNSIEPVCKKFEDACNEILDGLGVNKFVRVNRKAFYNGSPHRMVESISSEIKMGLTSINEGRIDLGRDPVEGGDVFAVDSNNMTYATWKELPSIRDQIYGQSNNEQPSEDEQDENLNGGDENE